MTKTILNATAVIRLNENSIDLLRKMQLHHEIPEDAKYIAFLEDGDACFLTEELVTPRGLLPALPKFCMFSMYENIPIEFEE